LGPRGTRKQRGWKRLHKEELNDISFSPNIIRVIKKKMGWTGHVTCMGRKEVYTGFWWGKLRERESLENPGVDRLLLLKWNFRKWDWCVWNGLMWPRIGTGGGFL